jgi:predicted helicase
MRVWLSAEWPGRWGPDRGIDLVAQTFIGRVDAVQAKNYGPDHTVTKRDIETFLSESNPCCDVAGRLYRGVAQQLLHAL